MVDLHTHILPGIDDGSSSADVSAAQLQALYAQGVRKVAFTPHYYGRRHSPEQFLEHRKEAAGSIKDRIPADMEVILGAEVHFTPHLFFPDEQLGKLSYGETRYILFELPFHNEWATSLWQRIGDFIFETDRIPVVAHVERYPEILKNPSLLSVLTDMGCLFQVNTSSFVEKSTRGFVFALLKHGLVHCLGTDTHNMLDRAPKYESARQAILAAGYQDRFEQIQENMENVWRDLPVKLETTKPVKKFFGKYR